MFLVVSFQKSDIRALPHSNQLYDAYISLGVIEHFTDRQILILEEVARVIKIGGIFVSVPF